MHLLVTAGNTQVPIDRVRCLTNIFTGRTGGTIAWHARQRGHRVTLLTSHPDVLGEIGAPPTSQEDGWWVVPYRTFDDLQTLFAKHIARPELAGVIHSAAVSDYLAGGVYAPQPGTRFDSASATWHGQPPQLRDRQAGKVKSDEPELWLRLVRAPKLIDQVRSLGFKGVLVKFKLEVGIGEEQLLAIAERSRLHSQADLMVANTLEGAQVSAYLGPCAGSYARLPREELPAALLDAIEHIHGEKQHG